MRIGAVIVRVVASALLVASGALSVAAATQRWWPACKPFGFDHPDCLKIQDSLYNYVMPSPPWIPVGNAALLAALGLFLLSLAVLVVIPVLMGRRYRLLAWSVGLAMSLSVIPPAAATWLSAQGGQPVTDIPWLAPAQGFWGIGWPIALMVLAVVVALWMLDTSVVPRPPAKWQLLVLLCLAVNSTWVEYFATAFVMLYMSYDTTPWTGAVSGFALIIAGLALWPAFAQPAAGDEDHQDSGMAGPASEVEHVSPS